MGEKMKVGIVGAGRIALARSAKFLAKNADIAWVCSRVREKAEAFCREIGRQSSAIQPPPEALADWEGAVRRSDVQGIYIAAPNALHYRMAGAALEAGKHVLLEYPPATSTDEVKKLGDLAARKEKLVHVGLTYRYSAYHDTVCSLLWDPEDPYGVGAPHAFLHLDSDGGSISRWYNRDEMTGGTYISSMFDQFDEAIAIFGRVKDLMAHYRAVRRADGVIEEDCCSAMMVFENRCTAQIVYTRGYPRPALEIERTFICEKGHIRIQGGEIRILTAKGEKNIGFPEKDALLLDTADFLEGMESGQAVDDTFEISRYALEISERAMKMAIG